MHCALLSPLHLLRCHSPFHRNPAFITCRQSAIARVSPFSAARFLPSYEHNAFALALSFTRMTDIEVLPLLAEMERWRSFFAQAEGDLWTIINQAILLAAVDFPAEFKHKRCEIAEILFARRPCPSPQARSMDATRLSGSVITISTADREKDHYQTCREEVNGISRVEVKGADTHSHGTVSKESAVKRHALHGDKSVERDTCVQTCNDSRDFPEALDLSMDHGILLNVSMIKDQIMNSTNQSEDGLLRALCALEHLDIDVEILKATDIGREVNKFRKHTSGPIRNLVKQLVRTWKGMVDEWVRDAEVVHPLNASGEQEVVNREVRRTNSRTEASTLRSLHLSKQAANKSIADSTCTVLAHSLNEHTVEEMGSSRVESDELYRPGFIERKANSSGQQVQFSRCIVTKSSTGGFGPGRPVTNIPEAHRVFVNETVACVHHEDSDEKFRKYVQGGGSQKTGYGKSTIAQNVSAADNERIETMKRRLPSEDQLSERAKKQRDMPPSSGLELSKKGFLGARLPACEQAQHCIPKR